MYMNNQDELLRLYNELDDVLRDRYHISDRSTSVILKYSNELSRSAIPSLKEIGKKLNMIRILRNDLIHELDSNASSLFEIKDETIKFNNSFIEKWKIDSNNEIISIVSIGSAK